MEIVAKSSMVRTTPRKARLVAGSLRGLSLDQALSALAFTRKSAAGPVLETIKQAVANATHNFKLAQKDLRLKKVVIDGGPVMKRFRPGARGRVKPYTRRTSHITVVLEGQKVEGKVAVKESEKEANQKKGETKKGKEKNRGTQS